MLSWVSLYRQKIREEGPNEPNAPIKVQGVYWTTQGQNCAYSSRLLLACGQPRICDLCTVSDISRQTNKWDAHTHTHTHQYKSEASAPLRYHAVPAPLTCLRPNERDSLSRRDSLAASPRRVKTFPLPPRSTAGKIPEISPRKDRHPLPVIAPTRSCSCSSSPFTSPAASACC